MLILRRKRKPAAEAMIAVARRELAKQQRRSERSRF